jgi:hypothetical protein
VLSTGLAERARVETCATCGGAERVLDPCPACEGTGRSRVRCRECFTWRPVGEFLRGGRLVRRCRGCRERPRAPRAEISAEGPLLVKWNPRSHNSKTGPIPVSMTSRRTCPPSCPWLGDGCYAEQYFVAVHWRRLGAGRGITWSDFCARVAALSDGQLWRHNEAGDLPGDGDEIDERRLLELAVASRHTRGFTYTHKPVLGEEGESYANRRKLADARMVGAGGLVVNLSADGLLHADQLCDLGLLPVVAVVPRGSPRVLRTPAGRRVVTCPALHDEGTCCANCGLCARADRDFLIGFPTHGAQSKRMGESLVQLKLFTR